MGNSGYSNDKSEPTDKPAASDPAPPVDSKGLRTDGPTLEEYVAAGYKADTYPPHGYAVRVAVAATAADKRKGA